MKHTRVNGGIVLYKHNFTEVAPVWEVCGLENPVFTFDRTPINAEKNERRRALDKRHTIL